MGRQGGGEEGRFSAVDCILTDYHMGEWICGEHHWFPYHFRDASLNFNTLNNVPYCLDPIPVKIWINLKQFPR